MLWGIVFLILLLYMQNRPICTFYFKSLVPLYIHTYVCDTCISGGWTNLVWLHSITSSWVTSHWRLDSGNRHRCSHVSPAESPMLAFVIWN